MMAYTNPGQTLRRPARGWLLVLLAVAGCADSRATDSPKAPTAPAASPAPAKLAAKASTPAKTWRLAADFKPPFPERQEMFAPPSQAARAKAPHQAGAPDLALRGFADFNGRRAMLEIGGAVFLLREGEEQHGIKVLSIDPPRVTIQRGAQRWTESLVRDHTPRTPSR